MITGSAKAKPTPAVAGIVKKVKALAAKGGA